MEDKVRPEKGGDGEPRDEEPAEGPGQWPAFCTWSSEEPFPGGHAAPAGSSGYDAREPQHEANVPRQGDPPWFTLLLATYKDSAKPVDGNGPGHQPRTGKNRVCKDRLLNKVYTNPDLAKEFYPNCLSGGKITRWARWLPIQRSSNPRFQTNVFIVFLSDRFYPQMSLMPADPETLQMLHPTNAGYEPAFQFVVAVDSDEKAVQDFRDRVQSLFSLEKKTAIELETVGELVLNSDWTYTDYIHSCSIPWEFQCHPKETFWPVPPPGARPFFDWPF